MICMQFLILPDCFACSYYCCRTFVQDFVYGRQLFDEYDKTYQDCRLQLNNYRKEENHGNLSKFYLVCVLNYLNLPLV